MKCPKQRKIISSALTFLAFWIVPAVIASESVMIAMDKGVIKVGEGLILNVTYNFEEPKILPSSGDTIPSIVLDNLFLKVENKADGSSELVYIPKVCVFLEDTQGLIYKGETIIWYNLQNRSLVFDSEGSFSVRLLVNEKLKSNILSIEVITPETKEKEALSLLSNPDDFIFLLGGVCEKGQKIERINNLERIINQCDGTMLANWSAARLGIETEKELEKKYPDGETFMAQYRFGQIQEPLVEKAFTYLSTARDLPDAFPIREEVLYRSISIAILREEYNEALAFCDDLLEKYPKGVYGKRGSKAKEEIERLKEREERETNKPSEPNESISTK